MLRMPLDTLELKEENKAAISRWKSDKPLSNCSTFCRCLSISFSIFIYMLFAKATNFCLLASTISSVKFMDFWSTTSTISLNRLKLNKTSTFPNKSSSFRWVRSNFLHWGENWAYAHKAKSPCIVIFPLYTFPSVFWKVSWINCSTLHTDSIRNETLSSLSS